MSNETEIKMDTREMFYGRGARWRATVPADAVGFAIGAPCPGCEEKRYVTMIDFKERKYDCVPAGVPYSGDLPRHHHESLPPVFLDVDRAKITVYRDGRPAETIDGEAVAQ